jgi:hypothetical protein
MTRGDAPRKAEQHRLPSDTAHDVLPEAADQRRVTELPLVVEA